MSYQENIVGNQLPHVFALAIPLVSILCSPGQYESCGWLTAVILAVPLRPDRDAVALSAVGLANNSYTQIGLMLLIALRRQERHPDRRGRPRSPPGRRASRSPKAGAASRPPARASGRS
jgi:hypothetical protein